MLEELSKLEQERLGTFEYERAVYQGSLGLPVGPEKRALFDLSQDPGELSPLAQEEFASSYNRLEALLDDFHKPGAA